MEKGSLLVEDRDTSYLFSNTSKAPKEAKKVNVKIDPSIPTEQLENEAVVLWLINQECTHLKVVLRTNERFWQQQGFAEYYAIPAPMIVEDEAEMQTRLNE